MKKVLFITNIRIKEHSFGGGKASVGIFTCLSQFADITVEHIGKQSSIKSLLSCFAGLYPPNLPSDIQAVCNHIDQKNFDVIFFNGSQFGSFCEQIKHKFPNVKIIVFFHNCEADYNNVRFTKKVSIKKLIYYQLIKNEEKKSVTYGDMLITFSERDRERIYELYGKQPQFIIPLSLEDSFNGEKKGNYKDSILLFGPAESANIQGYDWFIKNVSPYIKATTILAGKGFEKYKNIYENKNVKVIGYVNDINELYSSVSCVAIPLLSGAGMKIKTAEALMHGKTVFGTNEAFVGYSLPNEVAFLCNSAEEFKLSINNYLNMKLPSFNEGARDIYENRYSINATMHLFKELITYD